MPNHAFVLGVDRYATDLDSLTGAVADAQAFASWLVQSGEVAAANLHLGLLPGDGSPPLPALLQDCPKIGTTLDELDGLLGDWLDAPPADVERFYFFFSGHGAASSNPLYAEEAICLQGFSDRSWRRALEVSSLIGVLNAIAAKERFILIDGCRNAVFRDDIRFGTLSRQPRPAPGQRRNYVLRATGPGRKAAELDGRGLFARHLCEGLQGAGTAKRWDPTADKANGGYTVRWRALGEYVFSMVAQHRAAQRHEQLIYEEGEHPATEDPLLASFSAQHFGSSRLSVRLLDPPKPPEHTQIFLRRNDSTDSDLSKDLPGTGQVEFDVAPSAWVLWARAAGWRSQPKSKPVPVYAARVEEVIALMPEPPADAPGSDRSPPTSEPSGSHAAPATRVSDGRLRIRVGGSALAQMRPAVRVAVRRESGEVVRDPVMEEVLALAPGVYRVRLDVAGGGAWTEASLLIVPGQEEILDLPLPDITTPALQRTLAAGGKLPSAGGFAEPSEIMGQLAAPSVATVAAIAVAQAVQGYQYGLVSLGLGTRWITGDVIGVEVLVADEREAVDGAALAQARARLWRMQVMNNAPVAGTLAPTHAAAPIASTSLVVDEGGYWLQLRDTDRKRRAGMKLATFVLPGHVTLVVRHRLPSGAVALLQFAVRRDPHRRPEIQLGLVQGEVLQRARATGRDPVADPAVRELAQGAWFEPFSALVAAAALLERGNEGNAMFEQVLSALIAHDIRGPDIAVLGAARATRAGKHDMAASLIRDALGMHQAPLIDSLLERLEGEARRLDGARKEARWITQKLQQTVGHPLWTLRREDDKRKSGKPDAV